MSRLKWFFWQKGKAKRWDLFACVRRLLMGAIRGKRDYYSEAHFTKWTANHLYPSEIWSSEPPLLVTLPRGENLNVWRKSEEKINGFIPKLYDCLIIASLTCIRILNMIFRPRLYAADIFMQRSSFFLDLWFRSGERKGPRASEQTREPFVREFSSPPQKYFLFWCSQFRADVNRQWALFPPQDFLSRRIANMKY